jgi:hypothetical protein
VEGPSDRIYLNRWIELIDPQLVEGLHYSIMFYGGRLLSHLRLTRIARGQADVSDLLQKVPSELIDLLKINQHAIIVIDSDRQRVGGRINSTKARVRDEAVASGGVCWITEGREIENYLPSAVVTRACEAKLGAAVEFADTTYDNFEEMLDAALRRAGQRPWRYADHKVTFARLFAEHFTADDMTQELRRHITDVVQRIASWNS